MSADGRRSLLACSGTACRAPTEETRAIPPEHNRQCLDSGGAAGSESRPF
jgi:hypothetical protein